MWGWGKKAVVFMSHWICHYSTYTNTCIHTAHTQTCKERLSAACRQLNTHTNSKLATVLQKILFQCFSHKLFLKLLMKGISQALLEAPPYMALVIIKPFGGVIPRRNTLHQPERLALVTAQFSRS